MVGLIDPQLGETVLDPASGTGGFLVEAFAHLARQVKTVEDRRLLQEGSLWGCEPKPLPYLLCQMNLLLHGLDAPRIDPGNALRFKLSEIGEKERVDIILTNPPFGGEEEKGIQGNFPEDRQTTETALLFLQLIMRKLHRVQTAAGRPARAAVVVPDGLLSQEGVGARIREALVKEFNLHTIVRLPRSVFAPYTKSSTSILFFDTAKVTDFVWFYQIPIRPDVKEYTQRRPFMFEECKPLFEWWRNRGVSDRAWMVTATQLREQEYSFGSSNPASGSSARFAEPNELLNSLSGSIDTSVSSLKEIAELWEKIVSQRRQWDLVPIRELLHPIERPVVVKAGTVYKLLAMSWYARGLYIKDTKDGSQIKGRLLFEVREGDFVYNRLFAWKGSFAEATAEVAGCFVSNEFPCYTLETARVAPGYLWAYFSQPDIWEAIERTSSGTTSTSRLRLKEAKLAAMHVPLPPKPVQMQIARIAESVRALRSLLENATKDAPGLADAMLERACRKPSQFSA
jgi:type I restriction enzyme M protein